MLTVGDKFPEFELTACVSLEKGKEFETIDHKTYEGKWKVVFAWPKDFTFVCPTEIAAFGKLNDEFADRDAQVLGFSGDSEFVHHAWRKDHDDLRDLPFPMMADPKHELMRDLGIEGEDGYAKRAVFIVDQNNEIQFSMVTAGSVGRNPKEVLRVLDALQT
ncbi:peroxiredoxin, partial [Streptomyces coelicolor]|nr:peroxiredoxin [Streptomyces coelicolor]